MKIDLNQIDTNIKQQWPVEEKRKLNLMLEWDTNQSD